MPPGSLIDCHLQLQCPSAAEAEAFATNLYAALAGLYPQFVVGGDPTTALAPALVKFLHDSLVTFQAQSAAQAAVAQVTAAVEGAMAQVTPAVTVAFS